MLKLRCSDLLRKLRERYSLLSHLILASSTAHVLLIFSFLYLYRQPPIVIMIDSKINNLPIVLMPFSKKVLNNQKILNSSTQATTNPAIKKTSTVTTVLNHSKPKPKAKQKTIEKKAVKETKKTVVQKNKKEAKKRVVKPISKNLASEQNLIRPNYQALPMPDVIKVGGDEYDQLVEIRELQNAIKQQWNPPVGLHPDCKCSFKVDINSLGSVSQMEMLESSSVIIYNSAARLALAQTQFPKSVFGKSIIITFNK